jgi:hypothetical protein
VRNPRQPIPPPPSAAYPPPPSAVQTTPTGPGAWWAASSGPISSARTAGCAGRPARPQSAPLRRPSAVPLTANAEALLARYTP